MSHSPSIFITDLDGTLLTSQKSISARTRSALETVRENGIQSAVASARPYRLVESVLGDVLGLFDAIIVSNGAAVVDPGSGLAMNETLLSHDESDEIMRKLAERWPSAGFGWESGTYFGSDARFLDMAAAGGILRDPSVDHVGPCPLGGIHQLVMAVSDVVPRSIVDEAALLLGPVYTVTDSNGGVVEISPASVTKADGARWWANSVGFELTDAVAFGDEHNDLPLLSIVGHGIAMANATDEVKMAASSVTFSNDEDGVARVLETLVGGNRLAPQGQKP